MRRRVHALPDEPPTAPSIDDAPESGDRDRRVVQALLGRAERARRDPITFFSFVMREEKTHARIRAAPHQRLLFEFVLAHPRCVVRMPVGSSKTFCMAALTLWLLGNDPTERGAVISSSEAQAQKPLGMVQDYIEDKLGWYPELHLVFPELRKSPRAKDPWTQTKLVVDRPPGIRDPSLVAVGEDSERLPGSRLSWIVVDDILSVDNVRTPAARSKTKRWFDSTVMSRKDVEDARIVVTNTPWVAATPGDPGDLTYALERAGWPTLTMDVEGNVTIANAPDFDSDEIRPAWLTRGEVYRLTAHDAADYGAPLTHVVRGERVVVDGPNGGGVEPFDLDEQLPLWPEVYSLAKIARLKVDYAGALAEFNQLYRCVCRNDDDAACKVAWVDACKRLAVRAGFFRTVVEYRGPWPTVTGVDLALGQDEKHDKTCFFTFAVVPELVVDGKVHRNLRLVLDVDVGRYRGRQVVDKLVEKTTRYGSVARVETNGAQDFLRQWTLDVDAAVPVRAHTTGANKHQRVHGVAGVFIELENGAWLIPNDPRTGECSPGVTEWINDCLNYQPPPAHTGDALMASWLARAQAREVEAMLGVDAGGSVAAAVAAR